MNQTRHASHVLTISFDINEVMVHVVNESRTKGKECNPKEAILVLMPSKLKIVCTWHREDFLASALSV